MGGCGAARALLFQGGLVALGEPLGVRFGGVGPGCRKCALGAVVEGALGAFVRCWAATGLAACTQGTFVGAVVQGLRGVAHREWRRRLQARLDVTRREALQASRCCHPKGGGARELCHWGGGIAGDAVAREEVLRESKTVTRKEVLQENWLLRQRSSVLQ